MKRYKIGMAIWLATVLIIVLAAAKRLTFTIHRELVVESQRLKLIRATRRHDLQAVKRLLNAGADANAIVYVVEHRTDWTGILKIFGHRYDIPEASALTIATKRPIYNPNSVTDPNRPLPVDIEIAQELLAHGANANYRDGYGSSAINYAAAWCDCRLVNLLLSHGADVNSLGNSGETPLMDASNEGDVEVVKCLLDHGARVDAQDYEGLTALMDAAKRPDAGIVITLLAHNANTQLKDTNGWTAETIARKNGQAMIANMLHASGKK